MVLRFKVTIPSLTGDEERNAYVYLPVGYDENENKRYPVLYMFDGHNLFDDNEATYGKSWGLSAYLDYTDTQVIVAAVECNHVGNGRLSEYSPTSFYYNNRKIVGRGKKYMDWFSKDFKKLIDSQYRTLPSREHTAISGSSMGGLMTLYALAAYGKVYGKGAALSPSLWVGGEDLPSFLKTAKFRQNTLLYMDYGSKEFSNHSNQKHLYGTASTLLIEKGVFLTSRIVPFGTHCEASWEKQLPIIMQILGYERK